MLIQTMCCMWRALALSLGSTQSSLTVGYCKQPEAEGWAWVWGLEGITIMHPAQATKISSQTCHWPCLPHISVPTNVHQHIFNFVFLTTFTHVQKTRAQQRTRNCHSNAIVAKCTTTLIPTHFLCWAANRLKERKRRGEMRRAIKHLMLTQSK